MDLAVNFNLQDVGGYVLQNFVLAIVIGIVASFMFVWISTRIKPRVEISKDIAIEQDERTHQSVYAIKIINETISFFMRSSLADIHALLMFVRETQDETGPRWKVVERAKLERDEIFHLASQREKRGYVYTFRTTDDLHEWFDNYPDNGNIRYHLTFTIVCKHGFTGAVAEFSERWYAHPPKDGQHKDKIRPGYFGFGLDFHPTPQRPIAEDRLIG